jgi:cytochrome c-type biogenesis protein CcmH/NrfG
MQMKRVKDAIEILKLNVEMFPSGFNTYDSLAEAYMTNGDKSLAIQNYKKSLELNPKNTGAAEKLKKLEAAP